MRAQPAALRLIELAGDGGIAVAHGPGDFDVRMTRRTECAAQQLGLLFGVHGQRRAVLGPYRGVLGGGFAGARIEDDAVEDQPPERAREFPPRVDPTGTP